jgi:hypothetical protein
LERNNKIVGRRRSKNSTHKGELVAVLLILRAEYGLGINTIGKLLDYSPSYLHDLIHEFEIGGRANMATLVNFVRDHLPFELRARCERIRIKSGVARARSENRQKNNVSRVVHHLHDDEGGENDGSEQQAA